MAGPKDVEVGDLRQEINVLFTAQVAFGDIANLGAGGWAAWALGAASRDVGLNRWAGPMTP